VVGVWFGFSSMCLLVFTFSEMLASGCELFGVASLCNKEGLVIFPAHLRGFLGR
jgi:hypothetical protein